MWTAIVKGFGGNVLYFNTTQRPQITLQYVFFICSENANSCAENNQKLTDNMPTHLRRKEKITSKFDVFTILDIETNFERVLDQTQKSSVYLCFTLKEIQLFPVSFCTKIHNSTKKLKQVELFYFSGLIKECCREDSCEYFDGSHAG